MSWNPDLNQGWVLALLSAALSVLGSFFIYSDDLYTLLFPKFITSRFPFELKENYRFLVASLGFSSGCLIFTALYSLLPHSKTSLELSYLESNQVTLHLMISYWVGILVCGLLNALLHCLTSESVVHCSHEVHENGGNDRDVYGHHEHHHHSHFRSEEDVRDEHTTAFYNSPHEHNNGHYHTHNHSDSHLDSHEHSHYHEHGSSGEHGNSYSHATEEVSRYEPGPTSARSGSSSDDLRGSISEDTPLLVQPITKRFLFLHLFSEPVGECKGYTSAEVCVNETPKLHYCELPLLKDGQGLTPELHLTLTEFSHKRPVSVHTNHTDHHHHVNTPLSRLFLIGIQTTLTLTLHKVPEGFMTYITSEANSKLGVQIFLSLAVHNFIEGFSMCLPLYYLLSSTSRKHIAKLKALLIAGGLGGLSQPLGALAGSMFLRYNPVLRNDKESIEVLNYVFGVTLAVTSGFVTVIALTMFGSAVSFNNRSVNAVVTWSLLGIFVIGLTAIIATL